MVNLDTRSAFGGSVLKKPAVWASNRAQAVQKQVGKVGSIDFRGFADLVSSGSFSRIA